MIKVQINELKAEVEKFNGAVSDFETYSTNFIKDTVDSLESFNSDFVDEAIDLLENMTDSKAPDLLKNLISYCEKVNNVIESFEEVDNEIGKEIQRELGDSSD